MNSVTLMFMLGVAATASASPLETRSDAFSGDDLIWRSDNGKFLGDDLVWRSDNSKFLGNDLIWRSDNGK